jgi:GTP cyclohydrolase II
MSDPASPAPTRNRHIRLTSHPGQGAIGAPAIRWGADDAMERGPIVGTTSNRRQRNVIGTHSGSYGVYRALAVAAGNLVRGHRADLTDTSPTDPIGPHPAWGHPERIVSIDPWGAIVQQAFADYLAEGYDIRPTIAVTKARIHLPEVKQAIAFQRRAIDGRIVLDDASAAVTKIAAEPVWWLPGVARRFGVGEADLRRALFEETGGMYPELVTRSDIEVFLPPIGGQTLYVFGNARDLADPHVTLTARVHDECNGSDVFGSDICTCRPYLTHAIEECIRGAQQGGVGLIVYSRKEGRALGEVTKFLVYNARKRQQGGDRADRYFLRTECVAGVQDIPGADARRAALARHHANPPPGEHEQRQVRRDHRQRHRGRRAHPDSGGAGACRREGRNRGQDRRRLLHRRFGARRCAADQRQGARA